MGVFKNASCSELVGKRRLQRALQPSFVQSTAELMSNKLPVAPVLLMRSLPARSQRVSLPTVRTPVAWSVVAACTISRQCDLCNSTRIASKKLPLRTTSRHEPILLMQLTMYQVDVCVERTETFDLWARNPNIGHATEELLIMRIYQYEQVSASLEGSMKGEESLGVFYRLEWALMSWQPVARCSKPRAIMSRICSGEVTAAVTHSCLTPRLNDKCWCVQKQLVQGF